VKILVLSNLYPPYVLGGYEILCGQVTEQLRARGHDITVLTTRIPDGQHDAAPDAAGADYPVLRPLEPYLPFDRPAVRMRRRVRHVGRHNAEATRRVLARERFDLVFVWSQLRLTVGPLRVLRAQSVPTAITLNDEHLAAALPVALRHDPRGIAAYLLDRTLFRRDMLPSLDFASITCISERLKRDLLRRCVRVPHAKVIYQGIPVERFPVKDQPGAIGSPLRLLYVGQLHAYKGVHTLIEGAHRLVERLGGAEVNVMIIGDGPADYRAQLADAARAGPARVELVGKRQHDALPQSYREHDIFVFPSAWAEPFGLTHLEAMASGTPVVSTNDGGHAELLRDGENALVFPKGDAGALAERLARLVEQPDLALRLAAEARRDVEQQFSLTRYIGDLEDFLADAAARRH
jgi:glycosyltransferase involved in cell wall biosynthesis